MSEGGQLTGIIWPCAWTMAITFKDIKENPRFLLLPRIRWSVSVTSKTLISNLPYKKKFCWRLRRGMQHFLFRSGSGPTV